MSYYYWCFCLTQNWSWLIIFLLALTLPKKKQAALILVVSVNTYKPADMMFTHPVYVFSSSSGVTSVLLCGDGVFLFVTTVITECFKHFSVFSTVC